jgi:hypothetical protein
VDAVVCALLHRLGEDAKQNVTKMRKPFIVAAGMALAMAVSSSAFALAIIDVGVVGVADGVAGDNPGNDADDIAQAILDIVGASTTTTCFSPGRECQTGTVDYTDTIITVLGGKTNVPDDGSDPIVIPSGYQYAIAKYDGQSAGWVLFDLTLYDSGSYELPANSFSIWGKDEESYRMSSFTVFNPISVPDGGSTAVLLGAALLALGAVGRRFKG